MVNFAGRRLDFEVVPDVRGPVPVDRLDQCAGLFLVLNQATQPAELFFKRRI